MRSRLARFRGGSPQKLGCRMKQASTLEQQACAAAQLAALKHELAAGHSASHEPAEGVRSLLKWISSRRMAPWQGACEEPAMREALAHTPCPTQRSVAHPASLDCPPQQHSRLWWAGSNLCRHPPLGQQQRAASSIRTYGAARAHGAAIASQPGMSVGGSIAWRGLHSSSRADWQPSQHPRQGESTSPGQHQQARCEPLDWDEERQTAAGNRPQPLDWDEQPQPGPGLKPQPLDWDERPRQAARPQPLQHSQMHRPQGPHGGLRPGMQPQPPPRPFSRPGQGAAPGQGGRWQQAGQAPAAAAPVRRPLAWNDGPRPQQPAPQRMLRPPWQAPAGAAPPPPPPPGLPAKADAGAALPPDADVRLVYGEAGEHKVREAPHLAELMSMRPGTNPVENSVNGCHDCMVQRCSTPACADECSGAMHAQQQHGVSLQLRGVSGDKCCALVLPGVSGDDLRGGGKACRARGAGPAERGAAGGAARVQVTTMQQRTA